MNDRTFRLAAWPHVVVIACVLLFAGCQDGSGPGLVTSPEGKPAFEGAKPPPPPPPPADPAIAFVAQRGGRNLYDLKVMNVDGSNVTTIYTASTVLFGLPSWSPDGHSIAFVKSNDLWLIDVSVSNGVPTGTNARVLLDRSTSVSHPDWSADGTRIAFVDVSIGTLEVIPSIGGATEVLYTSSPGVWPSHPAWSRDGTQIAFTEGGAIRILDRVTGQAGTALEAVGAQFLDWARTQDALTFEAGPGGVQGVYILQLAVGTPTLVVAGGYSPTWSPDDQEILFSSSGLSKVNLASGQITSLGVSGRPMWPDWRIDATP